MNEAAAVRPEVAVVVGARGGLGSALVQALRNQARHDAVLALSRGAPDDEAQSTGPIDLADEASVAAAAARADRCGELRLVICASGALHGPQLHPERRWEELDPAALATAFAVNATGPAILAKHFLPRLARRGPAVFAVLSARVGSISDNRLGGWYAYRASKAALNMLVRTLSIELARRRPQAICVGLHPGTVETPLSRPFLAAGGGRPVFSPAESADHLLAVIGGLTPAHSGRIYAWDGSEIPP